jgi:hypothetical protein
MHHQHHQLMCKHDTALKESEFRRNPAPILQEVKFLGAACITENAGTAGVRVLAVNTIVTGSFFFITETVTPMEIIEKIHPFTKTGFSVFCVSVYDVPELV